jgi:hypothetical protein
MIVPVNYCSNTKAAITDRSQGRDAQGGSLPVCSAEDRYTNGVPSLPVPPSQTSFF